MPKTVICQSCNGTGKVYNPVTGTPKTCPACKGKRYVIIP